MNNDSEINELLAASSINNSHRRRTRIRPTPIRLINAVVPQDWKNLWFWKALEEQDQLCFRFKELTEGAQEKFCKLLKKDSSLRTINKSPIAGGLSLAEIKYTLDLLNPVIARNWSQSGRKFRFGSFTRFCEQTLSTAIYLANKNAYNIAAQMSKIQRYIN